MNGIQEVSGSIPLISTNDEKDREFSVLCPFLLFHRINSSRVFLRSLFRPPKAELQRPSAENRAGNHTAHAEKHNHKKADIHHRVHKACEQSDDRHNKPEKRRQL